MANVERVNAKRELSLPGFGGINVNEVVTLHR
jgi:hypothetical protein